MVAAYLVVCGSYGRLQIGTSVDNPFMFAVCYDIGQPKRGSEMNVSLTPELEQMVQSKVQAGRYGSASEVVFDALRMMDELDRIAVLQRGDLQMKIESGLRSLKNGRFSDGNEFFARMEADLDEEVRAEEERLAAKQGPEP